MILSRGARGVREGQEMSYQLCSFILIKHQSSNIKKYVCIFFDGYNYSAIMRKVAFFEIQDRRKLVRLMKILIKIPIVSAKNKQFHNNNIYETN